MKLNRAQSLAEYALVISLLIMASAGMYVYVKRGLQAKYKSIVDHAAMVAHTTSGLNTTSSQYEPYYLVSDFNYRYLSNTSTTQLGPGDDGRPGGAMARTLAAAVQDDMGNYVGGNVNETYGNAVQKGTKQEDLDADDGWQN